jgi:hypothetical protein
MFHNSFLGCSSDNFVRPVIIAIYNSKIVTWCLRFLHICEGLCLGSMKNAESLLDHCFH